MRDLPDHGTGAPPPTVQPLGVATVVRVSQRLVLLVLQRRVSPGEVLRSHSTRAVVGGVLKQLLTGPVSSALCGLGQTVLLLLLQGGGGEGRGAGGGGRGGHRAGLPVGGARGRREGPLDVVVSVLVSLGDNGSALAAFEPPRAIVSTDASGASGGERLLLVAAVRPPSVYHLGACLGRRVRGSWRQSRTFEAAAVGV